jgi:hypothetical protein
MYRRPVMGGRTFGAGVATVAAIVSCLLPRAAHAELMREAEAVRRGLESDGALVASAPPMFLEVGDIKVVSPLDLMASADPCLTVVLLAPRTVELTVVRGERTEAVDELVARAEEEKNPRQELSSAGLYMRSVCRDDVKSMERIAFKMRSPRGTIEVLVARSASPPTSLATLQLARDKGPTPPLSDPLKPLAGLPADQRMARAEARERAAGASAIATVSMVASSAGTGEFGLRVSPGCHSFDVFGGGSSPVDLDAELRPASSNDLLAQDRGEVPDPHLETCVPEVSDLSLRFVGAEPSGQVFVKDAVFVWPSWIDDRWGARVATTYANLFRRRKVPTPGKGPISEVLGGQGSTLSTIAVEPGRCYFAAVALSRGRSRGIRLTASASQSPSMEESGASGSGASVVFCSEDSDEARVRVDAPSASNWWVLSVWPLGDRDGSEP